MKSKSFSGKSTNLSQSNQSTISNKIDEQIEWYEYNSTRKEDDYICANLRLINELVENVENSEDLMFIDKIIGTFCEIIGIQRAVIYDLEQMDYSEIDENNIIYDNDINYNAHSQGFMNSYIAPTEKISDELQLQNKFTSYMIAQGKSSYTANDYCTRVRKIWNMFYKAYIGECEESEMLPKNLIEGVNEQTILPNSPLLNAYNHIEQLSCFISMKMAGDENNRNWANARAALNKFGEAVLDDIPEKGKVVAQTERKNKDFSRYFFEGVIYKKSRLVLAIVQKYVEDYRPNTIIELEKAFPSELQGSLGVVKLIDSVSDKYKGIGGVKRYFVDDNEIISLPSGERVIVCTQWGIDNTERLIKYVVNTLGYNVEKF